MFQIFQTIFLCNIYAPGAHSGEVITATGCHSLSCMCHLVINFKYLNFKNRIYINLGIIKVFWDHNSKSLNETQKVDSSQIV